MLWQVPELIMKISIIAALDEQNGIGYGNALLCHLPADLSYFKKMTMGKPIIMGRKTYESIGRPLPGRDNIVISQTLPVQIGITVVRSIKTAISLTQQYSEIFIIGGSQIFQETIEEATNLYITRIHHSFTADCYFPVIDPKEWVCISEELRVKDEANPYNMSFLIYERVSS